MSTLAPPRRPLQREDPFYGIGDPWAFARRALDDELAWRGGRLNPERKEEAVAYLVEVLCKLANRYDPERGLVSFSSYAYPILRRRYTSWLRSWRGDARYGQWLGGATGHEHAPARDDRGRALEPRRCSCGAQWLGNDGREDLVAQVEDDRGITDPETMAAAVRDLDHEKLSPRARGALTQIVYVMEVYGLTSSEAAARLAKTRRETKRDLDRLRQELEAAA